MYQLPQRSLAMRGREKVEWTSRTKEVSAAMEARRFWQEVEERWRVLRVEEWEDDVEGKRSWEVETGMESKEGMVVIPG